MRRRRNNFNNQANISQNYKYSKEDAYKSLDMINMWIGNADAKISYSLTFIGVLLGFFLTGNMPINLSGTMNKVFQKIQQIIYEGIQKSLKSVNFKEVIGVIILILICAFMVTSIMAIVYLYNALKGRIDSNVYRENGLVTKSNIYWGTISNMKYTDFYSNTNNLSQEKLLKDISSQIFINSKICTEKFKYYNKGVKYIVVSVIIFFIYKIIGCIML